MGAHKIKIDGDECKIDYCLCCHPPLEVPIGRYRQEPLRCIRQYGCSTGLEQGRRGQRRLSACGGREG